MFEYSKIKGLFALLTLSLLLGACSGGGSTDGGDVLFTCNDPLVINATGDACIEPPPIECPAGLIPNESNDACVPPVDESLPEPTVIAAEREGILFYNRPDGQYDGWELHIWNNGQCDAYTDEQLEGVVWTAGVLHDGVDPNYGAYWVLDLKEGHSDCGNFIVHMGDDKEHGGADKIMDLTGDRMNWSLSQVSDIFPNKIITLGISLTGSAAHMIDGNTLLWDVPPDTTGEVRIYGSNSAALDFVSNEGIAGSDYVSLAQTMITEDQAARFPALAGFSAWTGDLAADDVKGLLKGQIYAVAYDSTGALQAGTRVQVGGVLDDLYTSGDNDADEATLGVSYDGGNVNVSVWAPTAQSVNLNVYNADKSLASSNPMTEDSATGIWSFSGDSSLDRQFYRFEVTAYHPLTDAIETVESTDPYSLGLSTNGRYSQFVNLDDADLKPAGWDGHAVPALGDPEDSVIYEVHIRDFSAVEPTVSQDNRGKYLAFTESDSAPAQHLQSLVDAGLNTIHIMPANDISSVREDRAQIVDVTDTVGELCQVNSTAPVCGVESDSAVLYDVLMSYDPGGSDAQALVQAMRGYDSFNWGYDPVHFTAPDGSYASDPDGVARIREMRAMNQALHDMGLRVVLDVVYNHTSSSGLNDDSTFDKIVPGYYYRLNESSGAIETSTCCQNLAPERVMMGKFMTDSLVTWAEAYGYDGFRFDIMGHIPKQAILDARDAVRAIDADNYFYGEGWNFGEVADNRLFEQATQLNMAGTEVGSFNDRIREGVRQGALFNPDGSIQQQDHIRSGLAGGIADYVLEDASGTASTLFNVSWNGSPAGYAMDPADIINYVSKHDNETLYDQLQYVLPEDMSSGDRVRAHQVALSITTLAQGIPFMQFGADLIRSKSMDRNTYDAGDWFNRVDTTGEVVGWNRGLPLAEDNQSAWDAISAVLANPNTGFTSTDVALASSMATEFLTIRSISKLFRLPTGQDIIDRVGFHNTGPNQTQGLIVMSIDDGTGLTDLDPANDALVVIFNGSASEQTHEIPTAAGFALHPILAASADTVVQGASFSDGAFTVPPYTTAIFVKAQGAAQGEGLAADATSGAADVVPFGSTEIFIRGAMNDWGTGNPLPYEGDGFYATEIQLAPGDYAFKVADADWASVNYGDAPGADGVITLGEGKLLTPGDDSGNLMVTIELDDTYVFRLDARDTSAVVVTVDNKRPYGTSEVYLRGSMNDWGTGQPMTYVGNGTYETAIVLDPTTYNFKVADADWAAVNFGAEPGGDGTVMLAAGKFLTPGADSGNLGLTLDAGGSYLFRVDASNPNVPLLLVFDEFDFDGDGTPNESDDDIDGDGVLNADDAFPENPGESVDSDGDGVGDNTDAFPDDPSEQYDSDGDGIGDNADVEEPDPGPSEPEPGPPGFGDATLLLRGSLNDWGDTTPFAYDGAGNYTVLVELAAGAYDFKVATEDWETVNLGAGEDGTVALATAVPLTPGADSGNLTVTIETDGNYLFFLDAEDSNAPVLNVRTEVPFGETTALVRGSMNDWGESSPMNYDGDGIYSAALELAAGTYDFKVASSDWAAINLGADEDGTVTIGTPKDLVPGDSSGNLSIEIVEDGTYNFVLDAFNIVEPQLTVRTPVPYGDTVVLLRGSMNDWGESTPMPFDDATGWYSVEVDLSAGDYAFKVASADWEAVNAGAGDDPQVVVGEAKTLTIGGASGNLEISVESDTRLRFNLDASDLTAPLLLVQSAEPFSETALLRGSMNDWGEGTPMSYAGNNQYRVTTELMAGSYDFKVASADWAAINFGAGEDGTVTLNTPKVLTPGDSSGNLTLMVETDGNYVFQVDAGDPEAVTLGVFNEETFLGATLLLRGSMNDWGESTPLMYNGSSSYSVDVELAAGSYDFKVATADWATVNLGADTDGTVTLNAPKVLTPGDSTGNLTIELEADNTYTFTVNGPDPSAPTLVVSDPGS